MGLWKPKYEWSEDAGLPKVGGNVPFWDRLLAIVCVALFLFIGYWLAILGTVIWIMV